MAKIARFTILSIVVNLIFFNSFLIMPKAEDSNIAAIYVSTTGSDTNDGSINSPLKTLDKARSTIRDMKKQNTLPKNGINVILRQGEYKADLTFKFDKSDSGTKDQPIVYKAYDGEEVKITTTDTIDPSKFSPVTDQAILNRLPEEARGKVVYADLNALGIKDYGTLERKIYGKPMKSNFELFFNNEPMNISRWPNDKYVLTGQILNDGTDGSGIQYKFDNDRISRWSMADQALLYGFWRANWGDDSLHLQSISQNNKTITTVEPPSLGISSDRRFYIYNLLEEIDQPGEYFLDRNKGILYMYPSASMDNANIEYSTMVDPFMSLNEVSYVTFQNIIFDGTCGDGITMAKGSDVKIVNCKIRNVAGRAVNVEGTNNSGIWGSEIYNIGNAGIVFFTGDRNSLTPGNFTVENNHIYNYARYNKTYNPAVGCNGVGNRVANNLIHDAPHVAMMFSGNDNTIEYNEIFNVLRETDDCGAIYSGRNWTARGNVIQDNYIHDIVGTGMGAVGVYLDDMLCGTTVKSNIFYKVTMPILMGGGSDNVIQNNMIVQKTDNSSYSLQIDDRGLQDWFGGVYKKDVEGNELTKSLNAVPYQSDVWKKKYPELYNILNDNPLAPKRNIIKNNIISKHVPIAIAGSVSELGTVENNWETSKDLPFDDINKGNLKISDPNALSKFEGFENIPFEKIGLTGDGNYTKPSTVVSSSINNNTNAVPNPVTIKVDAINLGDLIQDKSNWVGTKTTPDFSGDGVAFKPGVIGYKGKSYGDGLLRFKLKPEKDYGWFAFTVRSDKVDKAPWEGAKGYVVVVKQSSIELQRWSGGTNKILNTVPNTFINTDQLSSIDFQTAVQGDVTDIILKIDGKDLFNYNDIDELAIKNEGYLTFFNGGKTSALNLSKPDDQVQVNTEPGTPAENTDTDQHIKVTIDGNPLTMDVEPSSVNDRILVPLRAIFEALNAKVVWDDSTQTVTANMSDKEIVLKIGDTNAKINGESQKLDVPAQIINDRTLVPVRFVSESLGATVDWDNASSTVVIKTK